jgi:REP element-mobilizing transposase RayT
VRTAVNNREPLFQDQWRAAALLLRVLREVKKLFPFEMRGFALEGDLLSFYIRPADGLQLPAIMQWLKQTFAVRFNRRDGRTGHLWGDRYWSRVLEGEPPPGAGEVDWKAVEAAAEAPAPANRRRPDRVCPLLAGKAARTRFSPEIPFRSASPPA